MIRDFIDIHGTQHVGVPVHVYRAGKQLLNEDVIVYHNNYVNDVRPQVCHVYYQMCFWINEAAKTASLEPLMFKFKNVSNNDVSAWRFELTAEYNGLSIEEACYKHFRNFVFPVNSVPGYYNPSTLV